MMRENSVLHFKLVRSVQFKISCLLYSDTPHVTHPVDVL